MAAAQPPLRIQTVTGDALLAHLPALAALRTTVFRAFPYLYDGNEGYEREYLSRYAGTPGAAVVLALDGDRVVGASTCAPLATEWGNVRAPFEATAWPIARTCYFGESVLLEQYRGRGAGVAFFTAREAHAASLGLDLCSFCAVIRPKDHPLRPAGYVPLDDFWRRRGYTPRPDLVCSMTWQDIFEPTETTKQLSFWAKSLSGAALP